MVLAWILWHVTSPGLSADDAERRRHYELLFERYVDALNGSVVAGPEGGPYACPCCGEMTLSERGGYLICSICWWEDDGQDEADADVVRGGPNGPLSLTEARRLFRERHQPPP